MCSLTSPHEQRTSGPKKIRSSVKKDFFNTICQDRKVIHGNRCDHITSWSHTLSDLPDGQITQKLVQPSSQKYSASSQTQIKSISIDVPARTEGRFAIVTNVGQGCGGRGLRAGRAMQLADGEVVWS